MTRKCDIVQLLSHRHSEQTALSEAEGTERKPVLSEVEGRSD
jgi:hypothetical protein